MNTKLLFYFFILMPTFLQAQMRRFVFQEPQMGAICNIAIFGEDSTKIEQAAKKAFMCIKSIHDMTDDASPDSEVNRVCQASINGRWVAVSPLFYQLLQRSHQLAQQTEGQFDVTVGILMRLWRKAQLLQALPSSAEMKTTLKKVGYQKVLFYPDTLKQSINLLTPYMQLNFSGIAKGFAAQEALNLLKKEGFSIVLIDIGGTMVAGDAPPNTKGWTIAPSQAVAGEVVLKNQALSTVNNMENPITITGKAFSSIINPKNGKASNEKKIITIIAKDGALAQALATVSTLVSESKAKKWLKKYQ